MRYEWEVLCDDGTTRWLPTSEVDEELIIKFNTRVDKADDLRDPDAAVNLADWHLHALDFSVRAIGASWSCGATTASRNQLSPIGMGHVVR